MNRKTKIAIGFTGLIIVVGLSTAAWRSRRDAKSAATYKEIIVQQGDLKIAVITTGTVQPENRLLIKPPIGGRIEQISVKEGDTVRKGQTLALMSSTDRAALIDAARARGAEELAHWEEIYRPAPLIAPMNGVIIARNVEPGQTLAAQDAAFIMSDHLLVVAQVDETDMAKISLGQSAEITLDAYPAATTPAKVTHIAYEARTVSNVTMYDVQVAPLEVPDYMRSGMTANVSFKIAEKSAILLLPITAIRKEDKRSLVYIKGPKQGNEPDSVEVVTGLSDGKTVEVVSGIKEDDIVLQVVVNRGEKKNETSSNPFSPFPRAGKSKSGGGGPPPPP